MNNLTLQIKCESYQRKVLGGLIIPKEKVIPLVKEIKEEINRLHQLEGILPKAFLDEDIKELNHYLILTQTFGGVS